jgi:hypothetical protein
MSGFRTRIAESWLHRQTPATLQTSAACNTAVADAESISANYWSAPQKSFLWQNRQNRHMNSRLPRLTPVLILIAAAALVAPRRGMPTDKAAGPESGGATKATDDTTTAPAKQIRRAHREAATIGDRLLMQAANKLEQRGSISARLRHQIAISGSQLYGVGSYWQQGSGDDLRVRLELQIAGQDAKLLQVSNGRFLWTERRLATGRFVTRVNLRQLRADPALAPAALEHIEPGEATWTTFQPELIAHCGGLPSLLAALGENFSFLPPQAMRLAAEPVPGSQPMSIPVFAVVGHWKQEKLSALVGENDGASIDAEASILSRLPDRLPQEVLLLVGQADLFPYRIEYRRLETPLTPTDNARPVPYELSANPMVVLELSDVAFDVQIATGQFDYSPGDADWVYLTAAVLERVHRERKTEVAAHADNNAASLPK